MLAVVVGAVVVVLVGVPVGAVVVGGSGDGVDVLVAHGHVGFEEGVLLYLLFDGLFEVSNRQLQQTHELYLLRRELLLQLLSLNLFHLWVVMGYLTISISSMRFLAPAKTSMTQSM